MNNLKIKNLAKPEKNAFIDGDWIEAPYISEEGIRLIQTGNIGVGEFKGNNKKYISEYSFRELRCKEVFPNDILICRLADPIGRAMRVPDLNERMITSVDVTIFRVSDEFNSDFVLHKINSDEVLSKLQELSGGSTRQRISRKNLGEVLLEIPNLPHQRKIAKILNTADAVIEKTNAAIAKYRTIKQGMIQDLFTRGINLQTGELRPAYNDAPHLYKETELGWIPKDWEVQPFSDLVFGKGVYGINAAAINYDPAKYAYLRITDISENGYFIPEGRKSVEHPEVRNFLLSEGDIVFARTGNSTGKTYLYDEKDGKLVFAGFLIKFHPNPNDLLPGFIKFYTETYWYWNWVEIYSARTGQPGINGNEYGKLPLPTPTITEQNLIVKKLNSINKKIESENKTLSKHQSLKKGLMQDLLSGRVEVEV